PVDLKFDEARTGRRDWSGSTNPQIWILIFRSEWRAAIADSGLPTDRGFPTRFRLTGRPEFSNLDPLRTSATGRANSAKVAGLVDTELLITR
ncbi:hypothetical protein U1Q18_034870, partial [Sarracenia purpurea var. burkii]